MLNTTTKYFDALSMFTAFETDTGEIISEDSKKLISMFEKVINKAYSVGFADGLEAAHD